MSTLRGMRPWFWGVLFVLLVILAIDAKQTASAGKPVEYVKICSLYGAGYYQIPGTDTCMKVGGFAEPVQCPADYYRVGNRCRSDAYRPRGYITADSREQTSYGSIRGYQPSGWDIAVGTAYNSYDYRFRVMHGTDEKINTSGESINVAIGYRGLWNLNNLNLFGAFRGTPVIANGGDWQDLMHHAIIDSGSVNGAAVFSTTFGGSYQVIDWYNWYANVYTAGNYTRTDLNGQTDFGTNVDLLHSNAWSWRVGASVEHAWTNGMTTSFLGYFAPVYRTVVGSFTGDGSGWGVSGAFTVPVPSAPSWELAFFAGYASQCAPLTFGIAKADYSSNVLSVGAALTTQFGSPNGVGPDPVSGIRLDKGWGWLSQN